MTGWKDKRIVMRRYNLTAEMYEGRYAKEQKSKYVAALENVVVADEVVLDVGCGSGLFFREIAAQAKMIIGLDISRKLLLQAKHHAAAFGNVFVLQADADYLPFGEGVFDLVFAFTVLQNMPDPSATLKELKSVAKTAGKIVVTGLKRFFSLTAFMDFLEASGLTLVTFVDREDLKCYVSVLTLSN